MQFGVVFPHHDIGSDPDVIADFAQALESVGVGHLRLYDHVLGAQQSDREPPLTGIYDENVPFHEPMALCGFLAGVTRALELATGVLILPQRQTALVAKQAAEVSLLSRGRFRLGVGVGWNHVEFTALNETFADRGKRIEEQVEMLRILWSDPLVSYQGRWHHIDRASILPRPALPIPIWFGGLSRVAQRRAARLGDGFIFAGDLAQAVTAIPQIREDVTRAGRDVGSFGIDVLLPADHGVEQARADLARCVELGVDYVTLAWQRTRYGSVDERLEVMATCLEAVRR